MCVSRLVFPIPQFTIGSVALPISNGIRKTSIISQIIGNTLLAQLFHEGYSG